MTAWPEPTRCVLCGNLERRDLAVRLVHWKDALPGMEYEHLTRCADAAACRTRLKRDGKGWPLVEMPADLLKEVS